MSSTETRRSAFGEGSVTVFDGETCPRFNLKTKYIIIATRQVLAYLFSSYKEVTNNHVSKEIKIIRFIFGMHVSLIGIMKIYRLKNERVISVYWGNFNFNLIRCLLQIRLLGCIVYIISMCCKCI